MYTMETLNKRMVCILGKNKQNEKVHHITEWDEI